MRSVIEKIRVDCSSGQGEGRPPEAGCSGQEDLEWIPVQVKRGEGRAVLMEEIPCTVDSQLTGTCGVG